MVKTVVDRCIGLRKGIEALEEALKRLELTLNEKVALKAILASSKKKYKTQHGTKPPSGGTSKYYKQLSLDEAKKKKRALLHHEIITITGYKTAGDMSDSVTNPRPLPGGGKKRHSKRQY